MYNQLTMIVIIMRNTLLIVLTDFRRIKGMKEKRTRRLLTAMLAMLMVFTFVPQMSAPVYATDSGKPAIQLVDNGSAPNITGAQASSIWFGNYWCNYPTSQGNILPIKWRVLQNADRKVFLLSDEILEYMQFHGSYENEIKWQESKMRSWLNGYDNSNDNFINTAFNAEERKAIADTELEESTDKLFLLSKDEAMEVEYGFQNTVSASDSRITGYTTYFDDKVKALYIGDPHLYLQYEVEWFLRSPSEEWETNHWLGSVVGNCDNCDNNGMNAGEIRGNEYSKYQGVRPALNIDLDSVLFTSAVNGGKDSGNLGTMTAVGTNTTDEWKLTLLDDDSTNAVGDGHKGFAIITDKVTYNSAAKTVTVPYSGAKTGDNEYISAIIKGSDGSIKYYGRIAQASSVANASVTISTANMGDGDTLCVFNEQCFNEQYYGKKKTDYASALMTVPYQVVYDSNGGSGTMASKGVFDGDTFTFPECTFTPPKNKAFDYWVMSGVDGIFQKGGTVLISNNCAQNGVITVTAHWKDAPPTPTPTPTPTPEPTPTPTPTPTTAPTVIGPTVKTTASISAGTMTVKWSWDKVYGAKSYKVAYRKVGSSKWTTKKTKETTYVVKGQKISGLYEYKVAAVTAAGDVWSNVSHRYFKSVKAEAKAGKGTIKVSWQKDKSATGYQVKVSTDKNMDNAQVIDAASSEKSCSISGLTKGKTYYVKVRPVKTHGGATYKGIMSKTLKVKVQ